MNPVANNNVNQETPRVDERVEEWIGYLLRGGVMLAAAWVLAGGILYLRQNAATTPEYHAFRGEPSELRNISGIVSDARHWIRVESFNSAFLY